MSGEWVLVYNVEFVWGVEGAVRENMDGWAGLIAEGGRRVAFARSSLKRRFS